MKFYLNIFLSMFMALAVVNCDIIGGGSDNYKITVTSTRCGFSGYYRVDDGSAKTFSGSSLTTLIYDYEKSFEQMEYIEISATRDDSESNMTIKIFEVGRPVVNETLTSSSSNDTLSVEYDFLESSNGSSSDTSSTDSSSERVSTTGVLTAAADTTEEEDPCADTSTTADINPSFTLDCDSGTRVCDFDASASTAANGIATYSWSFGDGTFEDTTTSQKVHTYSGTDTSFTVTLTIIDTLGDFESTVETVNL